MFSLWVCVIGSLIIKSILINQEVMKVSQNEVKNEQKQLLTKVSCSRTNSNRYDGQFFVFCLPLNQQLHWQLSLSLILINKVDKSLHLPADMLVLVVCKILQSRESHYDFCDFNP